MDASAGYGFAGLLASEELIRAFFRESSVGLNLCRMDGHWVSSNPAFLRIIGYRADEVDNGQVTYWQLTPRKYDADEQVQLASLASTGRYGPYEKEFVRKDGTIVPVRLNGFIIEVGGEKMIWSFIEDTSAERALEAARAEAIHAAKLAALGEMAAAIAHEVNNPLSVIGGYAYVLPDAIERADRDLINEAIGEIQNAVARTGAITNGLRRMALVNDEGAAVTFDVKKVIDEVTLLTGARTRAEGLELFLDVHTAGHVRGNSVQLGQVLVNLVNNAVDAVRTSPQRKIALRARDTDDAVVIDVDDSGPGVRPEHESRIFDAFFTTKQADQGTGLGLSISKAIVTSMGGTIAYAREGGTTTFSVRLPRTAEA